LGGILAFDLARNVGWAWSAFQRPADWRAHLRSGTHTLAAETGAPTVLAALAWIEEMILMAKPAHVVFEAPVPTTRNESHALTAFTLAGLVDAYAHRHSAVCHSAHNSSVKKFFSGNGNATKDQMVGVCRSMGIKVGSADEADAIALLHFAVHNLFPSALGSTAT
jgi:Holliday junction resolvasome RuvABC endonuclease subunit